jgi:hypothetical protein
MERLTMATSRNVRAILIDPWAMTVTEVQHDASDFHNIYVALTRTEEQATPEWPAHAVDCFDTAYGHSGNVLKPGDALFVDDNGLLLGQRLAGFKFDDQLLVGRALILGCDDQGETADAATPLATIKRNVAFGYHKPGRGE